jgi:hypothetical protein
MTLCILKYILHCWNMSLHLCPNITVEDIIYPHIGLNVILAVNGFKLTGN